MLFSFNGRTKNVPKENFSSWKGRCFKCIFAKKQSSSFMLSPALQEMGNSKFRSSYSQEAKRSLNGKGPLSPGLAITVHYSGHQSDLSANGVILCSGCGHNYLLFHNQWWVDFASDCIHFALTLRISEIWWGRNLTLSPILCQEIALNFSPSP